VIEACFSARALSALLYARNLTPAFFDLSSGEGRRDPPEAAELSHPAGRRLSAGRGRVQQSVRRDGRGRAPRAALQAVRDAAGGLGLADGSVTRSVRVIFTKRLRDGVRRGEITCSIRIWTRPHVKVGNRYRMEEGEIEVDSLLPIGLADITPELARESGFKGVVDLLKIAKHGRGENVYLVRFHYVPPAKRGRREEGLRRVSVFIDGRALAAQGRLEGPA
jgi:hypothetical protein